MCDGAWTTLLQPMIREHRRIERPGGDEVVGASAGEALDLAAYASVCRARQDRRTSEPDFASGPSAARYACEGAQLTILKRAGTRWRPSPGEIQAEGGRSSLGTSRGARPGSRDSRGLAGHRLLARRSGADVRCGAGKSQPLVRNSVRSALHV